MPFDNPSPELEIPNKAEIAILDEMVELIATPEKWCKGAFRGGGGSYCLIGAVQEATGVRCFSYPGARLACSVVCGLTRALGDVPNFFRPGGSVATFNDAPETTHADILNLIARTRRSFE